MLPTRRRARARAPAREPPDLRCYVPPSRRSTTASASAFAGTQRGSAVTSRAGSLGVCLSPVAKLLQSFSGQGYQAALGRARAACRRDHSATLSRRDTPSPHRRRTRSHRRARACSGEQRGRFSAARPRARSQTTSARSSRSGFRHPQHGRPDRPAGPPQALAATPTSGTSQPTRSRRRSRCTGPQRPATGRRTRPPAGRRRSTTTAGRSRWAPSSTTAQLGNGAGPGLSDGLTIVAGDSHAGTPQSARIVYWSAAS